MTHASRWVAVFLSTSLLFFVSGCAAPPSKEDLAALDYGACPRNYESKIKEEFKSGVLTAYSDELVIWPPQKFWFRTPLTEGSKLIAGYLVPVMAEQRRGINVALQGRQLYALLFKDDQLVRKLELAIFWQGIHQTSRIHETVGPLPRDEREWKLGHSRDGAKQQLVEFVLPGETVQAWSELITVHIVPHVPIAVTPERFVATTIELHKTKKPGSGCAVVSQQTLASTQTELLYEETLANCAPLRDEYSIRKALRGPQSMTVISYSKTTSMTDAEKKKWAEIVGRTAFLNECQRKP